MSAELRLPRADELVLPKDIPTASKIRAKAATEEERLERLHADLAIALGLAKPRNDNMRAG